MPAIRIPTPLRPFVGDRSEVAVQGGTAGEAFSDLLEQFPGLRPHLTTPEGQLRPFVNLFLDQDNLKDLSGLDTPLAEQDKLLLIPSIAGGRGPACWERP